MRCQKVGAVRHERGETAVREIVRGLECPVDVDGDVALRIRPCHMDLRAHGRTTCLSGAGQGTDRLIIAGVVAWDRRYDAGGENTGGGAECTGVWTPARYNEHIFTTPE